MTFHGFYITFAIPFRAKYTIEQRKILNITEQHIIYLLETYGLAAVPGFGVFMLHRCPATVKGNVLTAPCRELCFEPESGPIEDNTLARSIARATGTEEETCRMHIADDVNAMRRDIAIKGQTEIGNLGRIVSSPSGVLSFEQFSPMPGKWLDDIELQPLDDTITPVAEQTTGIVDEEQRETFIRLLRRTASSAAAIACFALIAFIASQIPHRDSEPRTTASIVLNDNLASAPIASPAVNEEEQAPLLIIFNTPSDGKAPVDATDAATTSAGQPEGNYCLVVASLASRTDAEKYIAGRQGFHILEKDGRYRVYTYSANSFDALQAIAKATDAYSDYPTAWICRR